jgi:hypothetical protein
MSTRRMLLAPVRAINPENLKILLEFLGQIMPLILQFFLPRPANAVIPKGKESIDAFLTRMEQLVDAAKLADEEVQHFIELFQSFIDAYIALTRGDETPV